MAKAETLRRATAGRLLPAVGLEPTASLAETRLGRPPTEGMGQDFARPPTEE